MNEVMREMRDATAQTTAAEPSVVLRARRCLLASCFPGLLFGAHRGCDAFECGQVLGEQRGDEMTPYRRDVDRGCSIEGVQAAGGEHEQASPAVGRVGFAPQQAARLHPAGMP